MAIYKLFPTADTTLYSGYVNANTGLDEILEATTNYKISNPAIEGGTPQASRFLLQFDQAEITSLFEDKIQNNTWRADLKCFTANVTGLSSTSVVKVNAIAESWNMGTGRFLDLPESQNGASWAYRTYEGGTLWTTSNYATGTTGSYNLATNSNSQGGGTWYTGSEASFTFNYYTDPDITADITSIVTNWSSSAFENYGVIVRQSSSQEFVENIHEQTTLKYFSRDTHTIYPPQIEFMWDDYVYNTGSLNVLDTVPATFSVKNNPGVFYNESVNRFRINSRPTYPTRIYQTGSLYTINNALPSESFYSIKDVFTNEVVIAYNSTYTKISCDPTGSYFDLYLNGLQPERYYKIELKTVIGETVLITEIDEFKISNE